MLCEFFFCMQLVAYDCIDDLIFRYYGWPSAFSTIDNATLVTPVCSVDVGCSLYQKSPYERISHSAFPGNSQIYQRYKIFPVLTWRQALFCGFYIVCI